MRKNMGFSDEQIHDLLELKDSITEKIEKYTKEIELMEKNLVALDLLLKQTSFTKASDLRTKPASEEPSIPIKKNSDGSVIANAHITPEKVSIILEGDVDLNPETPPFRTFFINRIIGEMEKKDHQEVENGRIGNESIINCVINKSGDKIREIIIKNYREKERVDEILNTAAWSLSKMIENSSK